MWGEDPRQVLLAPPVPCCGWCPLHHPLPLPPPLRVGHAVEGHLGQSPRPKSHLMMSQTQSRSRSPGRRSGTNMLTDTRLISSSILFTSLVSVTQKHTVHKPAMRWVKRTHVAQDLIIGEDFRLTTFLIISAIPPSDFGHTLYRAKSLPGMDCSQHGPVHRSKV